MASLVGQSSHHFLETVRQQSFYNNQAITAIKKVPPHMAVTPTAPPVKVGDEGLASVTVAFVDGDGDGDWEGNVSAAVDVTTLVVIDVVLIVVVEVVVVAAPAPAVDEGQSCAPSCWICAITSGGHTPGRQVARLA